MISAVRSSHSNKKYVMITTFYVLFGLNIVHEIINIVNPNYVYHLLDSIKAYAKLKETSCQTPEDTKDVIVPSVLIALCIAQQFMYMILTIIGLFTHQWFLFGCMIFISIIGSFIQNDNRTDWYARIDSVISAVLIITIIVNR